MSYKGTTCKRSDVKPGGWICSICNLQFRTRNELEIHKRETNHFLEKKGWQKQEHIKCKCEFCNKEWITTKAGFTIHKKYCEYNPNKQKYKSHSMKEFSEKISKGMKKAHSEGRAHNWGHLRSKITSSYPEKWLMKVIENEFNDKNYIHEMKFYKFSLNFCWPDKKLVIEMDGEQHYKEGEQYEKQRKRDKEKDKLLKKEGFKEIRVPWKECCNDPKQWIDILKHFIENGKIISFEKRYKTKKEIYNEGVKQRKEERHKVFNFKGEITPDYEWKRRYDIIKNYFPLRYGSITKINKETNLTRKHIYATINKFNILIIDR